MWKLLCWWEKPFNEKIQHLYKKYNNTKTNEVNTNYIHAKKVIYLELFARVCVKTTRVHNLTIVQTECSKKLVYTFIHLWWVGDKQ